VRLRSNGLWETRLCLEDGSRKSFYGKTQKEVLGKLREAQRQREAGIDLGAADKWTVASWLDYWLEQPCALSILAKPTLWSGPLADAAAQQQQTAVLAGRKRPRSVSRGARGFGS
jgi:hypothetical protein